MAVGVIAGLFALGLIFGGPDETGTLAPHDERAAPATTTTTSSEEPPPASTSTTTRRPSTTTARPRHAYLVSDVVDGDTIKLTRTHGGGTVTVRVLGIDTPETRDPRRGVGCYGPEASAWATRTLLGRSVAIATDSTQDVRDRYGRLLAYVRLPNGADYSTLAVRTGHAKHYVYNTPVSRASQLQAAEHSARANRRGLWGPPCHGDITGQALRSDPPPAASPAPGSGGSAPYKNCAAARSAGAAPLHRGDPGYGSHLDGDSDGVACE